MAEQVSIYNLHIQIQKSHQCIYGSETDFTDTDIDDMFDMSWYIFRTAWCDCYSKIVILMGIPQKVIHWSHVNMPHIQERQIGNKLTRRLIAIIDYEDVSTLR